MYRAVLLISKNVNNQKVVQISKQRNPVINRYLSNYAQNDAGFSMIEVVVVFLIIGILSAIIAPSWLAFVNRQKLNKANDAALAALQQAQTEAKKKKLSYSVSFQKNTTTQSVEVAIYPTKRGDGSNLPTNQINTWQPLGTGLGIDSKQLLLGTNLNGENTAGSSVSYTSTPKITFDYMGSIPNANFGSIPTGATEPPGLKILFTSPIGNSTSPNNVKRCVIIKTLLGTMITAKDGQCN
ncbi:type II secretion system protein [Chlorogloeopsis sp. ULAP02]|uniref:pilus assembly FimT family protein n=1 Tax=Chlorogloeopsis sp. ULAP02 TaxID=3107926 RepID=UPI0031373238